MLKQIWLVVILCCWAGLSHAQLAQKPDVPIIRVKKPNNFGLSTRVSSLPVLFPMKNNKRKVVKNKLGRNKFLNYKSSSTTKDTVLQSNIPKTYHKAATVVWNGVDNTLQNNVPADPSGAASKEYYVQMVNTAMQVFDKSGTSLSGPTALSSVFPGSSSDGDPMVLYDRFADRWLISQFQTASNQILIGISKTNDPTGEYYYYAYSFSSLPDYPKFSVWHDGYYMTINNLDENIICFERSKMIQGDSGARMISMKLPQLEHNGFFSALPAHAGGKYLPSLNVPMSIFYFQDDGWLDATKDEIKIWEMKVDWNITQNTSLVLKQNLSVAAFDSKFSVTNDDIVQKGSSQKLDAIPGAFMHTGQFSVFNDHHSVLLCHTIDVDPSTNMRAGIRWYELRDQKDGNWQIYQSSTFAPNDDNNRWMASMAMDRKGNIGLAYSIAGPSTFPSLAYTGRKFNDALGQMTLAEEIVNSGTGAQNNSNRFGDYSQMSLDPKDELSFWYTGEYVSSTEWQTGIFSFKIASDLVTDVGVVEILQPVNGVLSSTETVKVVLQNYGSSDQSSFNVKFKAGTNDLTYSYSQTLKAGVLDTITFPQTGDFSQPGFYQASSYTELAGDEDRLNDTLKVNLQHYFSKDVGVTALLQPETGVNIGPKKLKVKLRNYGIVPINSFIVAYSINGGNEETALYSSSIAARSDSIFEFPNAFDFSTPGQYQIAVYTKLLGDEYLKNDTLEITIENQDCAPISSCDFGDGLTLFEIGGFKNSSGCSAQDGYSDFTDSVISYNLSNTYQLKVQSGTTKQHLSVWVDFNDNFSFEPSERVLANFVFDNLDSVSFNLDGNSPLGKHLLRARTNWDNDADDPCTSYDYGETEDYTIDIVNSISRNELVEEPKILVKPYGIALEHSREGLLHVYNTLGQVVYTGNVQHNKEMKINIPKGSFLVVLTANNYRFVEKVVVR